MNRDMDLCRRILLSLEANPKASGRETVDLGIDDCEPDLLQYHIRLLVDAGLVEAAPGVSGTDGREVVSPKRLTFAGHEFVDTVRKDTFWQKAKKTALETTGGMSLGVLKAIAIKLVTDAVTRGGS